MKFYRLLLTAGASLTCFSEASAAFLYSTFARRHTLQMGGRFTRAVLYLAIVACLCFQFSASAQILFAGTGHYYQLVPRSDTTWLDARGGAARLSYLGMP